MSSNLSDSGDSRYNEYELVKQLFYRAYNELVDSLNLYELKQKPPSFRISLRERSIGSYDPRMHEVEMNEKYMRGIIKDIENVERLIKSAEELREFLPNKAYEANKVEEVIKELRNLERQIYRELEATAIHEAIHAIRYGLFPQTAEKDHAVRSKVEETLATLGEAIFWI